MSAAFEWALFWRLGSFFYCWVIVSRLEVCLGAERLRIHGLLSSRGSPGRELRLLSLTFEFWLFKHVSGYGACQSIELSATLCQLLHRWTCVEALASRVQHCRLREVLALWRARSSVEHALARASGKARRRSEAEVGLQCLCAWLSLALERKQLRRFAGKISTRCLFSDLARAFKGLQEAYQRHQECFTTLQDRHAKHMLHAALILWMITVRRCSRHKRLEARIASGWARRRCAHAFETWLSREAELEKLEHFCVNALMPLRGKRKRLEAAGACFRAWREEAAAGRVELMSRLDRYLRRRAQVDVFVVFGLWAQLTEQSQRTRARASRMQGERVRSCLFVGWAAWCEFARGAQISNKLTASWIIIERSVLRAWVWWRQAACVRRAERCQAIRAAARWMAARSQARPLVPWYDLWVERGCRQVPLARRQQGEGEGGEREGVQEEDYLERGEELVSTCVTSEGVYVSTAPVSPRFILASPCITSSLSLPASPREATMRSFKWV